MKRLVRGVALTFLGLTAAACGTAKYYTVAADPNRITETQTMLAACASQMGLESYNGEDVVNVKYDDTASLYYRYGGSGSYQVTVLVDDKKVAPAQMEAKQAAVKAKSDDIYACAQSRLNPPVQQQVVVMAPAAPPPPASGMSFEMKTNMNGPNASVSMNVTPPDGQSASASSSFSSSSSTSVSTSMGGTCAQAIDCYADVAKLVCPSGASKCSFKAEIKGNDESGCREAIAQVPQLLQAYRTTKPLPRSCQLP